MGCTPLRHCIRPGVVLLDTAAMSELGACVAAGLSLDRVPKHLLRPPGVNCSAVVPSNVDVFSSQAAASVEAHIQEIWAELRRNGR